MISKETMWMLCTKNRWIAFGRHRFFFDTITYACVCVLQYHLRMYMCVKLMYVYVCSTRLLMNACVRVCYAHVFGFDTIENEPRIICGRRPVDWTATETHSRQGRRTSPSPSIYSARKLWRSGLGFFLRAKPRWTPHVFEMVIFRASRMKQLLPLQQGCGGSKRNNTDQALTGREIHDRAWARLRS